MSLPKRARITIRDAWQLVRLFNQMGDHNPSSVPSACTPEVTAISGGASAWWIRWLSRLPWTAIYGLSTLLVGCLRHVFRYRVRVARDNLRRCFPDCSDAQIARLLSQNFRHLAQVVAEFF